MLSCVLPSRVAWPLDRQTSRNWARKTLEWADRQGGRESHSNVRACHARCRQGPKAEILIDFPSICRPSIWEGTCGRLRASLPFPAHDLVCQPWLPWFSAGVPPWAIDRNNSCAATCRLGHGCFLFQLGRDQHRTAKRSTAGTSTTLILLDHEARRDVVIANPWLHWPTTQIPAPLSFFLLRLGQASSLGLHVLAKRPPAPSSIGRDFFSLSPSPHCPYTTRSSKNLSSLILTPCIVVASTLHCSS